MEKKEKEFDLQFNGNIDLAFELFGEIGSQIDYVSDVRNDIDLCGMTNVRVDDYFKSLERLSNTFMSFVQILRSGAFGIEPVKKENNHEPEE